MTKWPVQKQTHQDARDIQKNTAIFGILDFFINDFSKKS